MIDLIRPYVAKKLISQKQLGPLVLFDYKEKCVYEKAWDKITLQCRGLIINSETGEIVARPFPKFFNLGEREEIRLENLPKIGYKVFDKADGSLGILYRFPGKERDFRIATRGSFDSDQARWGTQFIRRHHNYLISLPKEVTLLFEIIYPENKIIVDYKGKEDLVLLGAYNRFTGEEYPWEEVEYFANRFKFSLVKTYDLDLEQCLEKRETISKDCEGYVIRFDDGTRVKIKGRQYLKFFKILFQMTPLAFWENMKDGKIPEAYLAMIPEEFCDVSTELKEKLEMKYQTILKKILEEFERVKHIETRKEFAWAVLKKTKHEYALLGMKFPGSWSLDEYILNLIRPTNNVLD